MKIISKLLRDKLPPLKSPRSCLSVLAKKREHSLKTTLLKITFSRICKKHKLSKYQLTTEFSPSN